MLSPNAFVRNRYMIARQLGDETSAIYEAIDMNSRATVALKQLRLGDSDSAAPAGTSVPPQLSIAFEREARVLAGLRHPALPALSDSFIDGASAYLVAEFVPGEDMAEMMARERQPRHPDLILRWADQLLDALNYMHTQLPPVLHRDIKPQNLKLTPRGQMMLLDFGMAKGPAADGHARASNGAHSPFQFMAPELVQGTGADERSDLFGLAATLYYLLTGALPALAGKRANAKARGQSDPLQPAHVLNPDIPAAVSAVLAQALELAPGARPLSAAAMRAALVQALRTPSTSVPATIQLVMPDLPLAPPTTPPAVAPLAAQPVAPFSTALTPVLPAEPAPITSIPTEHLAAESPPAPPIEQPQPRRRWLLRTLIIGGVAIIALLLGLQLGRVATGLIGSGAPTTLATSIAQASPEQPSAEISTPAAPTMAPTTIAPPTVPPATPTVLATAPTDTLPDKPTALAVILAQASGVEPTSVFAGALPIVLTVRGSNLDQVRVVQFVSGGGAALIAEVRTRSEQQLDLSIPTLPAPIAGEVNYVLQLDGVAQKVPTLTLHDYRERKQVQGVLAEYDYTNRVGTDPSGAYTGLRSDPDPKSQQVGTLRNGDQVDILRDDQADWYQLRISQSSDAAQVGVIGWAERWLIDNQNVPARPPTPAPTPAARVFTGRVYSTPTDAAAQCGSVFESSIYGSVEIGGRGVAGAVVRVSSADGKNRYNITTGRGGVYSVGGLGCTTWTVRLISVPGGAIQSNTVTVKNLNGGRFTSAEVRFKS